MEQKERNELIEMGWKIHAVVEENCLRHPAGSSGGSGADGVERQRLLLADMAIHLLQTAIGPGDIELGRLRDNLHAILTISDKFLPRAQLRQATANIYIDQS